MHSSRKSAKTKRDSKSSFSHDKRWCPELKEGGYAPISSFFLKNYHQLKPYDLTHGEAMFVIHLMDYKWTAEAPYPAYKTIAQQMGVSVKTARRYAQSLEKKKYLERQARVGNTNLFNLQPLIGALVDLKTKQSASQSQKGKIK